MLGSCLSKYSRVSLRVLGISSCPWDGSQVGPVISSVSLTSLPLNFLQTGQILGELICGQVGVLIPPLGVLPSYEMATSGSICPNARSLSQSHPHILPGVSSTPGLWHLLENLPHIPSVFRSLSQPSFPPCFLHPSTSNHNFVSPSE